MSSLGNEDGRQITLDRGILGWTKPVKSVGSNQRVEWFPSGERGTYDGKLCERILPRTTFRMATCCVQTHRSGGMRTSVGQYSLHETLNSGVQDATLYGMYSMRFSIYHSRCGNWGFYLNTKGKLQHQVEYTHGKNRVMKLSKAMR
jgi:hypothetical protein